MRSLRTSPLLHHGFQNQQVLLCTSFVQSTSLQRRLASTSTAASKTTSTNPTNLSKPLSKVNGPPTTLPALLDLPIREPNQSFFPGYAFKLGKAYATFYKTGVFNIYKNFQASRPLQRTLSSKYGGSLSSAISSGALTRSEFQLLNRNWHDLKRVPAFALVFLICGEFTPLVDSETDPKRQEDFRGTEETFVSEFDGCATECSRI
ncbi:hypothetical protein D0Z07_7014 [Hyphodiscus hymeniophilus]|uniref:Uncharacterized protein n=1 Tax=Hyphodiscus hymeniophilus TaxID=353542 RepID=A0A9P6VGB2_9HELO|nr:hypothetical protein D0Z07_7014 [Hyphodiscus hymeniophilus]